MVNLEKMLELCRTRQWSVDDLDWTQPPRAMTREEEINSVRFFTNMAGIERLAKALFAEQERRAEDSRLKEIFASFVVDEERHAVAAERLVAHYNVHQYQTYELDPALVRFREPFLKAVRSVTPEMANAYVTAGELMLDIALLRSVNTYVNDPMSDQVMQLINRDEARHVAMDYHMTEYYASAAYQQKLREAPSPSLAARLQTTFTIGKMMFYARPFLIRVFLEPMDIADPQGERIKEAIKRMQLLAAKPEVGNRPFARFMSGLRGLYNTPVIGNIFGELLSRVIGAPGKYLVDLYDEEERQKTLNMSFDDMAKDAMAAKYQGRHTR